MLGIFAVDLRRLAGRAPADDQPRPLDGRPLPPRRHALRPPPHRQIAEFGGLAKVMPVFAFFLVFSTLASVGLPGLNGFVGEFLILAGSYRALGWPAARRHLRRRAGGDLPAEDAPAHALGADHQGEPQAHGPLLARGRRARAALRADAVDRRRAGLLPGVNFIHYSVKR